MSLLSFYFFCLLCTSGSFSTPPPWITDEMATRPPPPPGSSPTPPSNGDPMQSCSPPPPMNCMEECTGEFSDRTCTSSCSDGGDYVQTCCCDCSDRTFRVMCPPPPPPTTTTTSELITCNGTCETYCEENLQLPYPVVQGIVEDCLELIFANGTGSCQDFLPFQTPDTYCNRMKAHKQACGAICGMERNEETCRGRNCEGRSRDNDNDYGDDNVPAYCRTIKQQFCTVHIESASPNDASSEESLARSIRNFVSILDIGDITGGLRRVLRSVQTRGGMLGDSSAQGIFEAYNRVFSASFARSRQPQGYALEFLDGVDETIDQIGSDFINRTRNNPFFHSDTNLVTKVTRHRPSSPRKDKFKFPTEDVLENSTIASTASITIPYNALCDDLDNCSVVVGVSIIDNFADYLQEVFANSTNGSIAEPAAVLLSASVYESDNYTSKLEDNPVVLVFTLKNDSLSSDMEYNYTCVFVDTTENTWSSSGVTTDILPNGSIECTSTHLTSFTVLVSVTGNVSSSREEALAMSIVSYAGCAVSIVALTATIVILLALRKQLKKGVLLHIHLNLSISLLLALLVWVAGIDTATENDIACTVVAAMIQYFFLCTFCWMLSEGIVLYLLVVRVFGNAAKRWYLLLFLGWGFPIPIVAISAGLLHEDYRTENYCWIDADPSKAAIWTFVGPMLLVVTINAVILVVTVAAIVRGRKLGGAEHYVNILDLVKSALKGSIVLLPLLGLTWVFGLLAINSYTTVFSWLFIITNSLQGLFIFIFHVLRNDFFMKRLKVCFAKQKGDTTNLSYERKLSNQTSLKIDSKESSIVARNPLFSDSEEFNAKDSTIS